MNHALKMLSPQGGLFQVQTTSEPAAERAISRRTRFEGEASADEAYSPGSGAMLHEAVPYALELVV